jgi:hypothetical protein
MDQIAFLHDAINNEKFGAVVKSELGYQFEGDSAHASEWANWANKQNVKSLDSLDLPPGVIIGGFKNLTSEFKTSDLNLATSNNFVGGRQNMRLKSSEQISSKSRVPAIMDTPIKHFSNDKFLVAVNYKAAAFKSDVKKSSFLREVKSNRYAFDIENGKFSIPPKMEFKSLVRERLETNTSSSFERRLGLKMVKHTEFGGTRTAVGFDGELKTKSLGATIGGSTGSGARAGRRAAGMLNARFDPNAIDADGDKLVQEGTPFERPKVPNVAGIAKRTNATTRGVSFRQQKQGLRSLTGSGSGRQAMSDLKSMGFVDSDKSGYGVTFPEGSAVEKFYKEHVQKILEDGWGATNAHTLDQNGIDFYNDVHRILGIKIDTRKLGEKSYRKKIKSQLLSDDPKVLKNLFADAIVLVDGKHQRFGDLDIGGFGIELDERNIKKPRGLNSTSMGERARRETAIISNGLASRGKNKGSKTGFGTVKVHENDGKAWELLDDTQRATVKENLDNRREQLEQLIKESGDHWHAYLRNPKNTKGGTNYNSDLTPDFLAQFQHVLSDDLDEAKGEVDDKRRQHLISTNEAMQRHLDDLKTINAMRGKGDYSLLEHLHPLSRNAALGREQRAKNPEFKYTPVLKEGQKVPTLSKANPSTFFGKAGGRAEYVGEKELEGGKKAVIKKTTDTKLRRLNRRLFYANPEREAKRQRRKARQAGEGRAAEKAKPVDAAKARIRRAQRAIQAKLRGDESPADVAKRSAKTAAVTKHPLGIADAKDGNPMEAKYKINDNWLRRMALIANETGAALTGDKKKNRASRDTDLLNLWENNEFNALPTTISADVAERLIGAGWKPHNRGVGNDPGFGEAYLSEADRFIPGQGGRAYGTGEYWAPEGSSHAWGYGTVQIVGFISPHARTIKQNQIHDITAQGQQIQRQIHAFDAGHPGDEAAKMAPSDYVTELRASMEKALPDDNPVWQTPLGQIYKQTIDAYEKTSSDASDRKRIDTWAALQQMNRTIGYGDSGYVAPLLGYDAVDTGGDVLLVHNRGAMVTVDHSMSVDEGRRIVTAGRALRTQKKAA